MSGRISERKKREIARAVAISGGNITEASKEIGVPKATVSRIARRPEVQAMIEAEQTEFYKSLPNARQNIQYLIDNFLVFDDEGNPKLNGAERARAFKASMDMLKGSGMLPSHINTLYVENLLQQKNTQIISPVIQELLDQQKKELEDMVIEGEYEEKDKNE
jgi:hypothetical protein